MDSKAVIGAVAMVIVVVGYAPYFRDILARKTRPHAVSWFIWGTLTAIGFAGQLSDSAGPGAWATGFTSLLCFLVCILGLRAGGTRIDLLDWVSLIGAGGALTLWAITRDPLLSVIIVTTIYALGYIPTFRKSYSWPYEETMITYFLSGLTCLFSMFALTHVSLVTALYPGAIFLMNWAFTAMLLIRRGQIDRAVGGDRVFATE